MALAITPSSDQATTVSCDTQRCTQTLLKAMNEEVNVQMNEMKLRISHESIAQA